MASTAVVLDIRANTQKALGEFKKFSAQLDNKFLISGLKLDVVRNALSQINKEFQRAIGEQGLTASQSIKGAENQAAVLLDTFKNVGLEAGLALSKNISESLAQVAVTAGGTAEDIKAALAATPFISRTLGEDLRKQLSGGILEFQRDLRRAGLGDEFGNIAKNILSGQADVLQLINSGTPIGSLLGKELLERGGVVNLSELTPAQRTKILAEILNDKSLRDLIQKIGKETSGYKVILEDLNTNLFNPRKGVFGYLRDVSLATEGITTNVFKETTALVESIFGPQGLFLNFFKNIANVFGIEDPLRFIIRNIRFLTDQFNKLNDFIQSEAFQNVLVKIKEVFGRIKKFFTKLFDSILEATGSTSFDNLISRIGIAIGKVFEFFTNIYIFIEKEFQNPNSILGNIKLIGTSVFSFFGSIVDTIKAQDWDPDKIISSVKEIGTNVRKLIENVGKSIREANVGEQGSFFLSLFKTVIGEVAQTLGTAIKEAILLIFSGKGLAILAGVVDVLYSSLSKLFTGLFGGSEVAGKIAGAIAGTAVLAVFAKKIRTAVMSFLNRLVNAFPGSSFIKNRVRSLFQGDTRTPHRGSMDMFQRAVLRYLRNIERCVCRNVLGRGAGGRGARDPFTGRRYPRHTPREYLPETDVDGGETTPARRRRPGTRRRYARRRYSGFMRGIKNIITGDDYLDDIDIPQTRDQTVRQRARNIREIRNRKAANAYYESTGKIRSPIGRNLGRMGKGLGIAGSLITALSLASIIGAPRSNSKTLEEQGIPEEERKEILRQEKREKTRGVLGLGAGILGGAAGGAAAGAAVGTLFGPGIGTAIGGALGSIIGGILGEEAVNALSDPVIDAISGFGDTIGSFFTQTIPDWWSKKTSFLSNIDIGKLFTTTLSFSNPLSVLMNLGGPLVDLVRSIDIFKPAIETFDNVIDGFKSWFSSTPVGKFFGFQTNFKGLNAAGPALAHEARMSGGNAMVVNDKEFVIPSNGFATLANLVALKNTPSALVSGASATNPAPQINLTINVSGIFSSDDLEDALRDPVSNIVEDAYNKAASARKNQVNGRA